MPSTPFTQAAAHIGGDLTSEQLYQSAYIGLYAGSTMVNIPGIKIFTSDGSPVRIPKLSVETVDSGDWYGEAEAIAISQGATASVTLLPASLKSLKTLYVASNEVVRAAGNLIGDASRQLGGGLMAAMAVQVATAVDSALIGGSGTGNTIKGLANQTGLTTIDAGGPLSVDDIFDAEITVRTNNANPTVIVMHPSVYGAVRKLKTTSGGYLVQPDITDGQFGSIGGLRLYVTPHCPAGTALVFDPTYIAVATSNTGRIDTTSDAFFQTDSIGVRVTSRWDIAPIYNEAVVIISGITG